MTSLYKPLAAALLITCCLTSTFSQVDSVAQSEEYYKLGMEVFNYLHRKQATELFSLSAQWNPKNAKAHLMTGKSIMFTVHKDQSLKHFKKAWQLNKTVDEDILYLLGRAYHYSELYDSAIVFYDRFNKVLASTERSDKSNRIKDVNRKLFECRNAKFFMQNPEPVTITHLNTNINSEFPDYAPTITADEKMMFFTSRRPEGNLNVKMAEDLEYFEEILYSTFENGEWKPAKNMPPPINTEFHNSCISISPDGREMILYTDENGGDLLLSVRNSSGVWSVPKPMEGINTEHIENSAALSANNKFLYFTSDRPGGYGGTDIYQAELASNGRWTKVQNLGDKVNTPYDEEGVFISVSGKHLYFSSNGHAGMGDLDLFKTSRDSVTGLWSNPVNLGYPINSPENDIYFVLNSDETVAYFSSVRKNNIGEQDIYKVDMKKWRAFEVPNADQLTSSTTTTPAIEQVPLLASPLSSEVIINVTVMDAVTRSKVDAQLSLAGGADRVDLAKKTTGVYSASVKSNSTQPLVYKLNINSSGYTPQSSTLYLGGFSTTSVSLSDTVYLQKIAVPNQTVKDQQALIKAAPLNVPIKVEILFAHDSDEPLSYTGVKEFIDLMKNTPTMKVELGGHTDDQGDETYNKLLSQRRADALKRYLVKQGIDEARIKAVGYGSSKPVDTADTKEARRLNRRTEFTILEK